MTAFSRRLFKLVFYILILIMLKFEFEFAYKYFKPISCKTSHEISIPIHVKNFSDIVYLCLNDTTTLYAQHKKPMAN